MNILKQLTSPKYRLFTRKIKDVQMAIWELEFKVAKSRQVREQIRQDRDRSLEASINAKKALEQEKDEAKKADLQKQVEGLESDVKRYEAQMQMIDDQINGAPATEVSAPVVGINEQLDSYAELRKMYKEYRARI